MKRALAAAACLAGATLWGAEEIESITVVGTTPVRADDIDERDFPGRVQHFDSEALAHSGSLDVASFLERRAGGVHIHSAQGNPLQSDLYYRGFVASPLLGLPMGLTVYQNGVRLNEPLGDAINWDLLPMNAVAGLTLVGGSNPLYGLNTLGGSIVLRMKDGFSHPGHAVQMEGGSHHRFVGNVESGGGNERVAYYVNLQRFYERGWRDLSDSWAENAYATVGWRGAETAIDLDFHASRSDLTGNGMSPKGLLERDRAAVFTAPDITGNDATLWTLRGSRELGDASVVGHLSWRDSDTASFNGDGLDEDFFDEFVEVGFGGVEPLRGALRGVCLAAVEDELVDEAGDSGLGGDAAFVDAVAESGCGAVNNLSDRTQDTLSAVVEFDVPMRIQGVEHDLSAGAGYYRGRTVFQSRRQFALLDPALRSTLGPNAVGGGFAPEATDLGTRTARGYAYVGDTVRVSDRWMLSMSAYLHESTITLDDRSGAQPQLNGKHGYDNFNWGIGAVYRWSPGLRAHAAYNRASRLPTPIELACSEELAFNPVTGETEECRLPNAFLADPPLDEVVSETLDLGLRGERAGLSWKLGAFHTRSRDDIIWQTGETRAHGLFRNVDETLRRGFEASLAGSRGPLRWDLHYNHVKASFEDDFDVLSPNHPFNAGAEADDGDEPDGDDDAGTRPVRAGNAIPGVPEHLVKAFVAYDVSDRWAVSLNMIAASSSHLRGDESNELGTLAGYVTANAGVRYRTEKFEAFVLLENVFDEDYETLGLIGEEPDEIVGLDDLGDDVRFFAPGTPRSVWAGIRRRL